MSTNSARILVVDDEKLIRWSVGERLQRDGYEVIAAESGEQALDMVAANAPDLVLLDVRLPGIDGLTTLQRALAIQPDVPVLMMSAHSTVDIAVEAMKRGAIDFLLKPFPFQSLDAAVEQALATARTRRQMFRAAVNDTLSLAAGCAEEVAKGASARCCCATAAAIAQLIRGAVQS